jgi:hypothetical protein
MENGQKLQKKGDKYYRRAKSNVEGVAKLVYGVLCTLQLLTKKRKCK